MEKKRVVILLLDSFGIGYSNDAHIFGDVGSNTFSHIVEHCAKGLCNTEYRQGNLFLPNLAKKGLERASNLSTKKILKPSISNNDEVFASYGFCEEVSKGKDTPSGHWEIAGVPVLFDWMYFNKKNVENNSVFPKNFLDEWIKQADIKEGLLDGAHSSGTTIIEKLGDEHCKTKKPIIYTSADSVFQVAAHEEHFGLERLLKICEIARKVLDDLGMNIGRVIARPFVGNDKSNYARTGNRRDYSILPPDKTLLDILQENNKEVVSIGKIADIYAHQGITKKVKANGIDGLFHKTLDEFDSAKKDSLIFTNFVNFDSDFGHRRNVSGYANALEEIDKLLPLLDKKLTKNDMVVITADHGCDPTWPGSDHTREHVPFLVYGKNIKTYEIGKCDTFADIGQTIAEFLEVPLLKNGKSHLQYILK